MKRFRAWMEKLTDFMNRVFVPRASAISSNPWVKAVQDAIMAIVPMILVGSVITLVTILNEYFEWMPDFTWINSFSFGIIGLFVAFLIPYYLMQRKGHRDRQIVAGLASVSSYLILVQPVFTDDGAIQIAFERLGAVGMFTAIVTGLVVAAVFNLFSKFGLFKNSSELPDFIIVWFDSLLPILISLVTAWLLVVQLGLDTYAAIGVALSPLIAIAQSFWGFVLIYFLAAFLYSFGMSPWIVAGLVYPLQLQAIQDNAAALAAGGAAANIDTLETWMAWIAVGGHGGTLPLVVMMAFFARSARLKSIGRATLVPSLFNINEPVVFGAPVAFNPLLMVPMWLNSLIPPAIVYLALSSGLVGIPSQVFSMWYVPAGIQTWIVSPSVMSLLLLLVCVAVMTLTWLPFFRAYDRQVLAEDAAEGTAV